MADVSIVSCGSYEPEVCKKALLEVLEPIGGLDWVQPGMCIAIKANLVGAFEPDKGVTTHPTLLATLTRLLKDRGAGRVIIGDSPGGLYTESFLKRVYKVAGLQEAVDALIDKIVDTWRMKNSIIRPSAKDLIGAVGMLCDALNDQSVTWYRGQEMLRDSAVNSVKRSVSGGWAFGGDDAIPIEACALAFYGAKTCKRDPQRKMRIG